MRALALVFLLANQPSTRPVWTAPGANVLGAPTRDGRFLTCVEPATGDLALLETASGRLKRLTSNVPGSREFAYFSVPSPNGREIAYAWFNDAGFYDLRVISAEGGASRTLFRNEESGFVQPSAWTPDGRHILTLFFRKDNISQIALVEAESGKVRVLKSLNWVYPKKMDISPDSKWIVYDTFAGDKPGPRDLYLIALDGSLEKKLTTEPSEEVFPLFSPDGREVLYASDRSGKNALYSLSLESGASRLVRADIGRALPMGITHDGTLYYGLRTGSSDIVFSGMGTLETRTPGTNLAPAWSKDGSRLAYLSLRGAENFGTPSRVIVVRDLQARVERDLTTSMAHVEWLRWSPNGESLLAAGSDGKGRAGLFRIRAKDGQTRIVSLEESGNYRNIAGEWNAEGEPVRTPLPQDGTQWLERAGTRVFASSKGQIVERTAEGDKLIALKDYDGGPFGVSPDGNTIVYAAGRVRNEVWSLERVLAPSDRTH